MTEDEDLQRPEGRLLDTALKRDGRSARKMAQAIGMSDARVRQIINGYQRVNRQKVQVVGPATTIARIAHEVGVTAEQLRSAGREDAATVLADLDSLRGSARQQTPDPRDLHAYDNDVLLGELSRRLAARERPRAVAAEDPSPVLEIAADERESSIAGEQGHDETA